MAEKGPMADRERSMAGYPTELEKVWKMKEKQHAQATNKEVSQVLQLLRIVPVLNTSFPGLPESLLNLLPNYVYSIFNSEPLHIFHLIILNILENCFVSNLPSRLLLTRPGEAVCSSKLISAQGKAIIPACIAF